MFCDHCGADNVDTASTCFACQRPLDIASLSPAPSAPSTGAQDQDERELLASNTMLKGRYRILQCIGQGGFASVYKAEDIQQHKYVAVKEINLKQLKPREVIEATDAFNREVTTLSLLHHPGLPNMYDHFTNPRYWYLVMDYIEGETLERYLEQAAQGANQSRGIQVPDVLHIGIQLCTVLDYMHSHTPPIIFRDLKPANIMLTPGLSGRRVYLIDFGIARQFKPGLARDTIAFGSPGYAAPEQYGKAQTTPRSDIYSLGAILHQMLTGRDPAESPFHFAPVSIYRTPLPSRLDALILQMVDMEPQNRPDSALRVKEELEHCLRYPYDKSQGGYYSAGYQAATPAYGSTGTAPLNPGQLPYIPYPPSPANYQQGSSLAGGQQQLYYPSVSTGGQNQTYYTPSTQQPGGKGAQKRTTRRAVLITAGVMGAAWFISGQIFQNRTNTSPPQPVEATVMPVGASVTLTRNGEFTKHTGSVNALAWSHYYDNFVASASDDKTIQVWSPNSLDSGKVIICRGHTGAVTCIDCTHDNNRLASGSLDKTVRIWNMNGKQTAIATFPAAIHSVSWKSDAESLAVACADGKVYLCEGYTLRILSTYAKHTKSVQVVAWSPDGEYIASGGEDTTVRIWADTSGLPDYTIYQGHSNTVNTLSWSPDNKYIASGSSDRTVQIWRPVTGSTVTLYMGHMTSGASIASVDLSKSSPSAVRAVAWQPEGKYVASTGANGNIHVWDPLSGQTAFIDPYGAEMGMNAIAWSPYGNRLASTGVIGNVNVYKFSTS